MSVRFVSTRLLGKGSHSMAAALVSKSSISPTPSPPVYHHGCAQTIVPPIRDQHMHAWMESFSLGTLASTQRPASTAQLLLGACSMWSSGGRPAQTRPKIHHGTHRDPIDRQAWRAASHRRCHSMSLSARASCLTKANKTRHTTPERPHHPSRHPLHCNRYSSPLSSAQLPQPSCFKKEEKKSVFSAPK